MINKLNPSNKGKKFTVTNQFQHMVEKLMQQALALHQQSKLEEAHAIYEYILKLDPNHFDSMHLLGVIAVQGKNFSKAVNLFSTSLTLNPNNPACHSNMGIALREIGRLDEAIASYNRAIQLQPNYPEAYSNRGNILKNLSRLNEAIASYDQAIRINPNYAEAHYNRAIALKELGRLDEAIASYDQAIRIKPDYAEAYYNCGIALKELGRLKEAITTYDHAIHINPNFYEAYSNIGAVLKELGRLEEAIASYDQAIRIKPDYAEAYYNRAIALKELSRLDEAIASYDQAIRFKPDYTEAFNNRGNALYEMVRLDESRKSYLKALECDPYCIQARWAIPFSYIPPILFNSQDIDKLRQKFSAELDKLIEWFAGNEINNGYQAVGSCLPFYLAYQEFNNRDLLSQYGKLTRRIMADWQLKNNIVPIKSNTIEKIKVGIVGEQIRNHSVWNAITRGLVLNLDPSKFEIHIFHLGSISDQETELAKSKSSTFTKDKSSLNNWVHEIINKKIDVLIYPEIGMHALTTQLANLRIAPIQIVTWGHPETSGIPTIDFYLSGDLFEAENSQNFYLESLIELPNLGCCYSRMPIIADSFDFSRYGVDANEPVLICAGTLFKYLPDHDWVLIEIAKRLGKCKLIFFKMQEPWPSILKTRLEKLFKQANLDIEKFIVFIPRLSPNEFYGLLRKSDVFLDTIGFSGFNTAIQAVDCELPVVTRATEFMRGRLASGILKRMEMPDLIASTNNEYIELAVRLAKDKSYQKEIRKRMVLSRDILYDDLEPIRALEDFLIKKLEIKYRINKITDLH